MLNRICSHVNCDMPVLAGYRHCPRHLTDEDAVLFDDTAIPERLAAVYQTFYEDYEDATQDRAYELARAGYEVASRYEQDGQEHYMMVLAD